jgi:hypothetical protein
MRTKILRAHFFGAIFPFDDLKGMHIHIIWSRLKSRDAPCCFLKIEGYGMTRSQSGITFATSRRFMMRGLRVVEEKRTYIHSESN